MTTGPSEQSAHPAPGQAYLPIGVATPETLRTLMISFHADVGMYGVPFWVEPDVNACATCRAGAAVFLTPEGNFEATIPVAFLQSLHAQTATLFGREFTSYRVLSGACPHEFVLTVPDTLKMLLEPICSEVVILDDSNLGVWLSEPEDLTPQLSLDDISHAQFTALGLDPDTARTLLLTDVRYVSHLAIPSPDPFAPDTEVVTATAEIGSSNGDLVWATGYPVRLRGSRNSWFANSEYNDGQTLIEEIAERLVFTHQRDPADPCLLRVEALHDPHLVRRARYLGGDTATFGPDWCPRPDEEFRVELDAVSAQPFQAVELPAGLPRNVTVRTGQPLTGRVDSRSLQANPWTGGRFWALSLVIAETGQHAHYLRVLCPYVDGQRVRVGEHVSVGSATVTARVTP